MKNIENTKKGIDAAFQSILDHIDKDDYERAATEASEVEDKWGDDKDKNNQASVYIPYATYLKWFCKGYRKWQVSYHYTVIRDRFELASFLLNKPSDRNQLSEDKDKPDKGKNEHDLVRKGFELLSQMLCAYTWCENSFINNDPFAAKDQAEEAVRYENQAIGDLEKLDPSDPVLRKLRNWLLKYFQKNLYLHSGLEKCAHVYSKLLSQRRYDNSDREQLSYAENALTALKRSESRSNELASELEAHIIHVRRHLDRFQDKESPPTFLQIKGGKLVLTLSAGCNSDRAHRVITGEDAETFRKEIEKIFEERFGTGKISDYRVEQLHDIFETSFGRRFLETLSFDLPEVNVSILEDEQGKKQAYTFTTLVKLSAFGVCTVYFVLTIDDNSFPKELSVEQARTLQSLLCPHAGQIEIVPGIENLSAYRFFDRISTASLVNELNEQDKQRNSSLVDRLINRLDSSEDGYAKHMTEDKDLVQDVLDLTRSSPSLRQHITHYPSLLDVAHEYLYAVESAFHSYDGKNEQMSADYKSWILREGSGWYTYLYATALSEVKTDGGVRKPTVELEDLLTHPDAAGFVIDQREARASFDDWRFMKFDVSQEPNLATIRSHAADAFFFSPFQAFMYFPDDPQFLTSQYEATVEAMVRMKCALDFYNINAEIVSYDIRKKIEEIANRKTSNRRLERELETKVELVERLKQEANQTHNLISKASLSRYKDHGELMGRLVQQMKLDKLGELLSRHYQHLAELHEAILLKMRTRRERRIQTFLSFVASLMLIQVLQILVTASFEVIEIQDFVYFVCGYVAKNYCTSKGLESIQGLFFLFLSVGVFAVLIMVWGRLRKSE